MNPMDPSRDEITRVTRRHFLERCMGGVGQVALGSLLNPGLWSATQAAAESPLAARAPHFAPRAKNVIFLQMAGGPSQLDLFDYKPMLEKYNGTPCPEEYIRGEKFAFIRTVPKILASPHKFQRYGKSGAEISDLLPHTASIADDITIIKSMRTEQFNHAPAQIFMFTGFNLPGRPSLGSWVTYGLGSENQDLPGYVVMITGNQPDGGGACFGNGFLPSAHQGVRFRSEGDPVLYVSNPKGVDRERRRQSIDAVNDLNRMGLERAGDPEIEARIEQYELAFRMQASVPELSDLKSEPAEVHELYGSNPAEPSFANCCVMARRLVQRGVRFVHIVHWGWDSHGTSPGDDLMTGLPERCKQTDQPSAALVKDLKRLGLLDDTLVIWGGEFGRTPMNEERNGSKLLGRDHHPQSFSMWMAGGGLKPGVTHGATDELGYNAAEDIVHTHDLQATILNQLGLDHTRLTYKFQGRDFRLTDVSGEVVKKILA